MAAKALLGIFYHSNSFEPYPPFVQIDRWVRDISCTVNLVERKCLCLLF